MLISKVSHWSYLDQEKQPSFLCLNHLRQTQTLTPGVEKCRYLSKLSKEFLEIIDLFIMKLRNILEGVWFVARKIQKEEAIQQEQNQPLKKSWSPLAFQRITILLSVSPAATNQVRVPSPSETRRDLAGWAGSVRQLVGDVWNVASGPEGVTMVVVTHEMGFCAW